MIELNGSMVFFGRKKYSVRAFYLLQHNSTGSTSIIPKHVILHNH
jgi:hypothetical protein